MGNAGTLRNIKRKWDQQADRKTNENFGGIGRMTVLWIILLLLALPVMVWFSGYEKVRGLYHGKDNCQRS